MVHTAATLQSQQKAHWLAPTAARHIATLQGLSCVAAVGTVALPACCSEGGAARNGFLCCHHSRTCSQKVVACSDSSTTDKCSAGTTCGYCSHSSTQRSSSAELIPPGQPPEGSDSIYTAWLLFAWQHTVSNGSFCPHCVSVYKCLHEFLSSCYTG